MNKYYLAADITEKTKDAVYNRIVSAFDPLIQVVQGLAYPLAYISAGMGICLIILGYKRKGLKMTKWAGIGYILMQWLPSFMDILKDVGEAMQQ